MGNLERTVEKSFTVQPGGTLRVGTQGGDVRVEVPPGDAVKVIARETLRLRSSGGDVIVDTVKLASK